MKLIKPVVLILLCIGCAKPYKAPINKRIIADDLLPLVSQFEGDFGIKVWFEVGFVDSFSKVNIVGNCYSEGSYRKVEILESYKDTKYIDQIVYHELGHCALGLGHKDDAFDIMNSNISEDVSDSIDFYIQQMITFYDEGVYK